MVKRFIQWFFWRWILWRDWLMKHTEWAVKIGAMVLLSLTSWLFLAEQYGWFDLPDFHQFSKLDAWFWAAFLMLQAIVQLLLLHCSGSLKCRMWGDYALQFAGLSLFIVGAMFVAKYPPFTFYMAAFPILGFLVARAGRSLNKRSRQKINRENANNEMD